jgi:hypothetical protein
LSAYLLFDFGDYVDGAWIYKDDAQNGIANLAHEFLMWDLVTFDAWLYAGADWRGYPRIRQRLMASREQLTHSVSANAGNQTEQRKAVQEYFRSTRRIALRAENLPPTLRLAMMAVDLERAKRVVSEAQSKRLKRIQQEYKDKVQAGQKYGARSELARKYGLSLHTVRRSLKASQ